ncbi:hypothetical protein [uncultured Sphingobacterium sp.]|uniref:hypothetical protein n=1 Tax=uncultured Sphingobacterium sp. TaxID=182688 RepID=UPI0025D79AC0|nr:hypothetical protein [uncultured Sphingobacterium sp.]
MEELFTDIQLIEIARRCTEFDYTNRNELHLGFHPLDIIGQDKDTGLILAKGNLDTGYEHILSRHFGRPMKFYWKREDQSELTKLDNPTIFKNILPFELVKYGSQIFKSEYLKGSNENFDIYEGFVNYGVNDTNIKSRLITYKNQQIIHTFYISQLGEYKNKNKQKKYFRGSFSSSTDYMKCINKYSCFYYNSKKEKVFEYIEVYDNYNKKSNIKIVVDGSDFEIYNSTLLEQRFAPPFELTRKDMLVNDQFEKIAIDEYEKIKSST